MVSDALLEKLVVEAELFERTVHREQEAISKSVKSVSVTIVTPQRKNTFLYDTESAISQLESLQKHLKNDEALRSDLLHFQNRIRR